MRKLSKFYVLVLVLCFCAVPSVATVIFTSDFEGAGYEGWGVGSDGTLSTNPDWASNGPSIAGSQCLNLYPITPTLPTYVFAYHWVTVAPADSMKTKFDLTYDNRAVVGSMTQYWLVQFNYSDGTPTEYFYTGYANTSSTWAAFTVPTITPANGGLHPISQVLVKYFYAPYTSGGSYWSWIDNVVLTATPEPATMVILGLGSLIALRRRRK